MSNEAQWNLKRMLVMVSVGVLAATAVGMFVGFCCSMYMQNQASYKGELPVKEMMEACEHAITTSLQVK